MYSEMQNKKIVCKQWMTSHPSIVDVQGNDQEAVIEVRDGAAFFNNQALNLTKKGWEALYLDFTKVGY